MHFLIINFNSQQLTDRAIELAKLFLVKCLKPSTDFETFDELRLTAFDSNALKLDFEKTACTCTANARKHIQRVTTKCSCGFKYCKYKSGEKIAKIKSQNKFRFLTFFLKLNNI